MMEGGQGDGAQDVVLLQFPAWTSALSQFLVEDNLVMACSQTEIIPVRFATPKPAVAKCCGRLMVHEGNVVIAKSGTQWHGTPLGPEMANLECSG